MDFVFKLEKVLYSLKQVSRAWYERLSSFLVFNGFVKGKVDTTLLIKHVENNILIVQIYVDDIVFKSTNEKLCKDFESCTKKEFEMSMIGELNYFLGLQIKQRSDRIFINQAKYTRELIKKFGLENMKISKTPIATITKLDKDEQDKNIDTKLYPIMISSLLYLTISRSNIIFCVCLCARF